MNAITLTLDAPSTKAVTTKIHTSSAKPVTQQRLQLIIEAVQALNSLRSEEIKDFVEGLKMNKPKISKANSDLAAKLGVDLISDEEQRELENAALKNFFEWRQELLATSYTASEVAKLLGTKSRQTPHDRRKNKSLIAIQDNSVWKFPKWQFDPTGPDGVIPGLPEVLKALDVPDFSKISWLTRPNPGLNGCTPIQVLKKGQKDRVINEAQAVGVI
ncbi:MAG: MbcA/ParS/Xre antitoxin family protein [Tolypothrix brevis GSE-NOS-MK-07-07A]|jgi:hypothetical protein|nr:MbcA/ParS/Xre antitoxin family protein [Tolypothrix brevis GSE-NOS-MK-07-07A]